MQEGLPKDDQSSVKARVVRMRSGRDWVDVLVHADGSLFLAGYSLGDDVDADEARCVADELRSGAAGIHAGMYDLGPWVNRFGNPLSGQKGAAP